MNTSPSHTKLQLTAAMAKFEQRLHDFLYLRGLFVNSAEADHFWTALKTQAASDTSPSDQISALRQAFAECPLTAARYPADCIVRNQKVAGQMIATLANTNEALVFPGDSPSPASLLDVGCGDGQIASALAQHWQIEPSSAIVLDIIRPETLPANVSFKQMQPGILPSEISSRKFDLVVISLVLHHTDEPKSLLAQLPDVIKPGGILLVREHNADSPDMKLFLNTIHVLYEEIFALEEFAVPNEQHYFDLATWQGFATELGLTQIGLYDNPYPAEPKNTSGNFILVLRKPA